MIIFWVAIFIISLTLLVKGSDWLLEGSEKLGALAGLSPFVIGVVIVGFGTSLPEFASSLAGVFQGATDLPIANVVGSNIANILLIVGIATVMARRILITKNLIDLELPLLALSTILFVGVVYDGLLTRAEAIFLVLAFVVYIIYSFRNGHEDEEGIKVPRVPTKFSMLDSIKFIVGIGMLIAGAHYIVASVIALSTIFNVAVGAITLIAIAVGTSLPELAVSIKAAMAGKFDVSLGNIFGSNAFNALFVAGVPGLFATLTVDTATLTLGLPVMVVATFVLILSSMSHKLYAYEGAMYLLIYVFFVGRLFGWL